MPTSQPTGPTLQVQTANRLCVSNNQNIKNFGLTRCVFVSYLAANVNADEFSNEVYNEDDVGHHEKGMTHKVMHMSENSIDSRGLSGGLILLSNTAILGFLEAPDCKINEFLRLLGLSKMVGTVRVLATSFDIPHNVYNVNQFSIFSCNPTSEDNVDVEAEGPIPIATSIQNILATTASKLPPVYEKTITLLNKHECSNLPSSSRILACAKSNSYATSTEYLTLYQKEFNVSCESHFLWPLQSVVQVHDTTTV